MNVELALRRIDEMYGRLMATNKDRAAFEDLNRKSVIGSAPYLTDIFNGHAFETIYGMLGYFCAGLLFKPFKWYDKQNLKLVVNQYNNDNIKIGSAIHSFAHFGFVSHITNTYYMFRATPHNYENIAEYNPIEYAMWVDKCIGSNYIINNALFGINYMRGPY